MAIVRTVVMRLDDDVDAGVYVDDVAQEAQSAFIRNDSGRSVRIRFVWKNSQDIDRTYDGPGEFTQAVPPGQRKWIPLNVPDDDGELDTDFDSYRLEYV